MVKNKNASTMPGIFLIKRVF